jgi:hypothetical protein
LLPRTGSSAKLSKELSSNDPHRQGILIHFNALSVWFGGFSSKLFFVEVKAGRATSVLITTITHVIRFDDHYLPKQQHQDSEKLIAIPSESRALICRNSSINRAISLVIFCVAVTAAAAIMGLMTTNGAADRMPVFQGFCL